jgi:hypothetical protein
MRENSTIEFDSPWQQILEGHFQDFIGFFFPQADKEINWTRGFEFLDKEFQKAVRGAKVGSRYVDKLVKIWTIQNEEAWVLIHVEIQNQEQAIFAERMFVYYYRIYDRYRTKIASVAILGDENPSWRPSRFNSELWNCRLSLDFPVIKLTDYRENWSSLEHTKNPFAIIVMAHLAAQETRNLPSDRFVSRLTITRRLYEIGYQKEEIVDLYRFINWIMWLPEEMERKFETELQRYEESANMEYISSIERRAIARGMQKGIEQGQEMMRKPLLDNLKLALELKFGQKGLEFFPVISQLKSADDLSLFLDKLRAATTIDDLKRFYH